MYTFLVIKCSQFSCKDNYFYKSLPVPTGGLSLWLVVWLVVVKPAPAQGCPHLCVCYPSPMTISCQAQNLTIVPSGVPDESQRVFLQNNRITELRVGTFGFGTQVRGQLNTLESDILYFAYLFYEAVLQIKTKF